MQRVAVSAMKQSGQVWLPKVHELTDFKTIIKTEADQKFIAFVDPENPVPHLYKQAEQNKTYLVLIGPEGDFSSVEISESVKAGFKSISLGRNTLRSETAALAACHTLNLVNQ